MKSIRIFLAIIGLLMTCASAEAAVNVMTCEPEWGALAEELGGERVKVYSATIAAQDPHHIEARPSLIARARTADLLVCTGAELEVGWLPVLLREAANPKIQPGAPGWFEAAAWVSLREKPLRLDRSEGDLHAAGNPHIHTDPRNIGKVAEGLTRALAGVDPGGAVYYRTRYQSFRQRWESAVGRWEQQAASLKGVPIIVQHGSFNYLYEWLGIKVVATLEPKPGIEPNASHLAQLLGLLKNNPAKMVIRTNYDSPRPSQWISERSGIPAVVLPYTVGGSDQAKDLFTLFDDIVARLLGALR